MQLTKHRLESFSDGVIAIIITIMVLSIPLPPSFAAGDILKFLLSIFIYLVSFIVVGSFWNSHHRVFLMVEQPTARISAYNLLYLFFCRSFRCSPSGSSKTRAKFCRPSGTI
ncbi:MAG: TMEM175 family protein [Oscillospiraceae bacterium]|nr:TMEM175 family protein [Oscillospiraceae bacterium]